MRAWVSAVGVVALVGLLLFVAEAQPVAIVPGRAIGPVEIGMPLDRVRGLMESFGPVEEVDTPSTHGFCNPDRGVGVCALDRWLPLQLHTPGVVSYIFTDDDRFTTEVGGHRVGQPLLEFLRTYGLYTGGQGSVIRWDGRGLTVDVAPAEAGITVRFIGVFAPRNVSAQAAGR
jgi:hypothetical protein